MTIYLITPVKPGPVFFTPEMTASEYAAKERKKWLENEGYTATTISLYEVKTQGANFHTIAQMAHYLQQV